MSHRYKVLVVEDEAIVAMDLKHRLKSMGFKVTATVDNGASAIERVIENPPDLILMDIHIKGDIDGIETAEIIMKRYALPIVFLSANSDQATIERAKKSEPLAYLLKPFDDRELQVSIEIAIYRHKTEVEINNQKEWWETTLNSIGDGVIATDEKGIVKYINPVAINHTQWKNNNAVGKPISEVLLLYDEKTGEQIESPVSKVLDTGKTELLSNHTAIKRMDGTMLSIEDSAAPIRNKQDEIIGVVLVFHDATKHREFEHDSMNCQQKLEKQVEERTIELIEANNKLQQQILEIEEAEAKKQELQDQLDRAERMKSLGLLAGGVAHDLNNMLSPLIGYPELILERIPEDSSIKHYVELINKSARDASRVIQDLLTLARRGRYELEPTDINNVINEYLESPGFIRANNENPGIKIKVNLKQDIPLISGSSHHLSKLVMNLIVNAIDSMKKDGQLYISSDSQQITKLLSGHEAIDPGEYVLIKVKDTGSGIRPEDLDKIFEPYYSRKKMKSRSGSGLGLSVVYGIIKDHHGYYDILTEVDKGTEFIIYLPIAKDTQLITVEKQKDISGQERILAVDDDRIQRILIKDILNSLGYDVSVAQNGTEAVQMVRDNDYDLILLDMIMDDDLDGLDTYAEIIKYKPNQKAIIVSGFSENSRVSDAKKLGVGAYVKKPYDKKTLGSAVREELDKNPAPTPVG